MATREIEHQDRAFLKVKDVFQKTGDKFVGLYVGSEVNTRLEGTPVDYFFKQRDGTEVSITIKGSLDTQLKKAALQAGEKVTITFVSERETTKGNPQRIFNVKVDDAPKGAAPAPAPKPKPVHNEDW